VEGSPPLIHLLTRAAETIHPSLTRLPAMLGAYVLAIALFKIVAVRTGVLYGLVAMLVPFVTHANYHVTEARPYAPVLGCSALAFLCWQRISFPSTRRLALFGLWLSLLFASGLHYYAPLAVIPLALGEIARSLQQRKIDVPVWLAFTAPIIPLLLYVPLIRVMMTFTDGFWSRSSPILLMHPYEVLFGPAVPFAILALAFIAASSLFSGGSDRTQALPLPEIVAAIRFTLLPLIAFGLVHFTVGVLVPRYVLATVIGPAVLIGLLPYRRSSLTGIALLLAFAVSWTLTAPLQYYAAIRQAPNTYAILSEIPFNAGADRR
jgi:hypothetical protein